MSLEHDPKEPSPECYLAARGFLSLPRYHQSNGIQEYLSRSSSPWAYHLSFSLSQSDLSTNRGPHPRHEPNEPKNPVLSRSNLARCSQERPSQSHPVRYSDHGRYWYHHRTYPCYRAPTAGYNTHAYCCSRSCAAYHPYTKSQYLDGYSPSFWRLAQVVTLEFQLHAPLRPESTWQLQF